MLTVSSVTALPESCGCAHHPIHHARVLCRIQDAREVATLISDAEDTPGGVVQGRSPGEPDRVRPERAVSLRMAIRPRRDTAPELALRRAMHALGLRYRLQWALPWNRRCKVDVVFTRAKVAVFVDGCFWHGCPRHCVQPQRNGDWWRWKITRNQERDQVTTQSLEREGWTVLRFWEHEDPQVCADVVYERVMAVESQEGLATPGQHQRGSGRPAQR
ncbi:very short patch repair endonuclease [Mumia flava]|uniref:very short patch repair endonuclease n=1 Tax=Mumia flava TaxID=1348852 RepID=UPI000C247CF4|nr:very short patch repair endonuclease [Mumia flava]